MLVIINGLTLPGAFEEANESRLFYREIGCWELKQNKDFYGHCLETEIGTIYSNSDEIKKHSDNNTNYFPPEYDFEDESEDYKNKTEFIPYILDFSKIIEFGISGDGSPFCFDFRENLNEPCVIWWDDVYWRKIAPNFTTFMELFDLNK